MDNTTADSGSIDAVSESLIQAPVNDEEEETLELGQADEADATDQPDADASDADEADAGDDDDTDEGNDEADADADEDEPAERLYTVKVNGREQQATLPELLRSFSGQAYIQQGMQEVKAARTETENIFTALMNERQQLAQFVQAAQAGDIPLRPPSLPDDTLLQSDPIGYLEARVKYDKDLAGFQQAQATMQDMNARTQQAEAHARQAYLADQHRQLSQVIPAFAKPETARALKEELSRVGTQVYGFAPEELLSIADSRMIYALHDAVQYRRLMAGKGAPGKQSTPPSTPVMKPGAKAAQKTGKRASAEKARVQMKRTGSVDDVARFLLM